MKDWMYLEGVGNVQFVCDRGDLLNDPIWANELMLQFLGGTFGLGCEVDVVRG